MGIRVDLRPACAADRLFAEAVYFETQRWLIEELFGRRGDEVESAKFAAFYRQDETSIIVVRGEDAGWMTVVRSGDAIELDGIYILPQFQRLGFGTALIRGLMLQASLEGKPLRLSTAKINPARALYRRLAFQETKEDRYKVYMEYRG